MLEVIVPSVLSSLIVGMASAWLASQRAIATVKHQLATFEHRLTATEKATSDMAAQNLSNGQLLVELKTKVDLILDRLIPSGGL